MWNNTSHCGKRKKKGTFIMVRENGREKKIRKQEIYCNRLDTRWRKFSTIVIKKIIVIVAAAEKSLFLITMVDKFLR